MTSLQAAWDRAPARERAREIAVEGFEGAARRGAGRGRGPGRARPLGRGRLGLRLAEARAAVGRHPLGWRAAPPGSDARRVQALRDGYTPPSGGR